LDKIHIALAADDNYAQHVAVVVASVMANATTKDICFHVLSDNISDEKKDKIVATATTLGAEADIIELANIELFTGLFTSGHISRAAYFRLDIANLVDASVKKIVYMDVDLVVYGDIVELYNQNLQNKPLGAVPDFGIMSSKRLMKQKNKVLGLRTDDQYFNSGVLLLDLDKWRKENYAKEVIELAASGNLPHHDQDALNKVFYGKWQALPLKWNVIPPVFNLFFKILWNSSLRKMAIEAKRNQCIMHFAGRYKPWEFAKQEMFNNGYYEYLAKTAFKDSSMPQPGKNMQGKSITRALWRLKLADFWCQL